MLGEERDDSAEDGSAFYGTRFVFRHETWPNFDLVANFQNASQNTTTSNASLQIFDFSTRFVNIERADNDHVRRGTKVSYRNRDFIDYSLIDGVDIVLELGGYGNDRRFVCNCASNKILD